MLQGHPSSQPWTVLSHSWNSLRASPITFLPSSAAQVAPYNASYGGILVGSGATRMGKWANLLDTIYTYIMFIQRLNNVFVGVIQLFTAL